MAEAFSVVAALATVVQACALVALHFLPTGYDPVRDAVSGEPPSSKEARKCLP